MTTKLEKFFANQGLQPMGTLIHHGVKGQKWGVRRSDSQLSGGKSSSKSSSGKSIRERLGIRTTAEKTAGGQTATTASGVKVQTDASGKIVSAKGGKLTARLDVRGMNIKNVPLANADAIRAKTTLSTIKKTKSLVSVSDSDLNHLVNRLGLEKRYSEATRTTSPITKTHSSIKTLLGLGNTMNSAIKFAASPAGMLLASKVGLDKAASTAVNAIKVADLANMSDKKK